MTYWDKWLMGGGEKAWGRAERGGVCVRTAFRSAFPNLGSSTFYINL